MKHPLLVLPEILFHLFGRWNLAHDFDVSVHNQCRGHHDTECHDIVDVRDFLELILDAEFLCRGLGVFSQLFALRAASAQDLDLFNTVSPP